MAVVESKSFSVWGLGPIPAKAVDEEAHGEGANDAAHGEDGDGGGPQRGKGGPGDVLRVPAGPRLVVEALDDLEVGDGNVGVDKGQPY